MKLTKRPVVRRTDPTEQGEYMPGFQAQAMLVEVRGIDALAAARALMEAAANGQIPARCIRRKDEFYSRRHVPDDPAVITRQLRAPHEQSPAAVHPEEWTAILRQIDEIEAEGKEDDDAAFTSLVRLASKHDMGRWSFHFWRTDAFENSQHTTLEDVDFRRSEVFAMCARPKENGGAGVSIVAVSSWLANQFTGDSTKSLTKETLRKLAIEAFPNLSARRFDVIWSTAAPEERRLGGRPRKTPH